MVMVVMVMAHRASRIRVASVVAPQTGSKNERVLLVVFVVVENIEFVERYGE
jgi:hypothetical protein